MEPGAAVAAYKPDTTTRDLLVKTAPVTSTRDCSLSAHNVTTAAKNSAQEEGGEKTQKTRLVVIFAEQEDRAYVYTHTHTLSLHVTRDCIYVECVRAREREQAREDCSMPMGRDEAQTNTCDPRLLK